MTRKTATLVLDDGSMFHGFSFGFDKAVAGEVVFNTAMTGYPESLTDPSYAGQLMVLTYPLVGNYGVPPFSIEENGLPTFMESEKIHAEAIIVSDYSEEYSHWNAVESLSDWLKREMIPGITGIDTRATILGHVQRGGSPTLRDRVNASAMGYQAVCLLEQGKYNRIVGMKGEKLVDYPVDEALEMTKTLDPVLIDVCNTISI